MERLMKTNEVRRTVHDGNEYEMGKKGDLGDSRVS